MDSQRSRPTLGAFSGTLFIIAILAGTLAVLFSDALRPGHTLFSNDGPLGALMAECHRMPETITGAWNDLNSIGFREGGTPISFTYGFMYLVGPIMFSKLYPPLAILFLGMGAWTLFRSLRFSPVACGIGAIATCLNSSFFSAAAWGVGPHTVAIGFTFFALAALARNAFARHWALTPLAGLAVGCAVVEGADLGALLSLLVAVWVMYQAWVVGGTDKRAIATGIGRVAIVALFAGFMAAQTVSVLVSTQVQGVAGTGQDTQTKEERWDWATQWSLPKKEALSFIIPGVFGYRMDTPEGGNYWGAVGRDPSWDRFFASGKEGQPPPGFMRFTGGGVYAGILVVMVAVWAALQALRKKDSVFGLEARKWIWFWSAVFLISLLLSFGRFAPFYQFLYALPYFSTIRNPAKFTHFANFALVVLFAYGVHGLWKHYMDSASGLPGRLDLKGWWAKVRGFDRGWTLGCLMALAAGVLGWLIYASSRKEFVDYLQTVQFDAGMAQTIAAFSSRQVAIWLLLFAVAILLITIILSGAFRGPKAKWGAILLGLFVVADLGRANKPWIIVWDYTQKYASNEILDFLRNKEDYQRVAILPGWMQQFIRGGEDPGLLDQLYRIEWAQHHMLYYNIPSLDIVQMPRVPEDLAAFEGALSPRQASDLATLVTRRWELTSTRYLFGVADYLPFLNSQLDAGKERFRIAQRFAILPKAGIEQPRRLEELTAVVVTNGPYALFDFTGALPRAKLYTDWQVIPASDALLKRLADPAFDPWKTVLLQEALDGASAPGTNTIPGSVEITEYHPKHITMGAEATTGSVLLLNDRYDPNWNVYVDGEKKELLRPNFLMRGVFLQPGKHKVEFKFEPPAKLLFVNAAAWGVGLLLVIALIVLNRRGSSSENPQEPAKAAKA